MHLSILGLQFAQILDILVLASTAFLGSWTGWQPARLERPCGPPAVQSPTAQVRNEDSLFCDVKGNYLYNHYTWGNSSPFLYLIHYVEDTFRRCFIVRLLPPALTEWLHPRFWRPTGLVQLVHFTGKAGSTAFLVSGGRGVSERSGPE